MGFGLRGKRNILRLVVLSANPEFRALFQMRPRGELNRGIPSAGPNRRENFWLEIFSPTRLQDLRILFSKPNVFPLERKEKVPSSAFGESAFPDEENIVQIPPGSTCQGTRPRRWDRGWLGTGSVSAPQVIEFLRFPVRN